MSSSPIIRRLSSSTSMSGDPKEDLINAYEAEEERIINVLSRKLEQVPGFFFFFFFWWWLIVDVLVL